MLFNFKEVCAFYGRKDSLLIDKKNAKTIDCMGHEFKIESFCDSKLLKDPLYTRSRFDLAEDKVSCQRASAVIVSIACDKKHDEYCLKPDAGCVKMKRFFAKNLDFVRSSIFISKVRQLKCYYLAKTDLKNNLDDKL